MTCTPPHESSASIAWWVQDANNTSTARFWLVARVSLAHSNPLPLRSQECASWLLCLSSPRVPFQSFQNACPGSSLDIAVTRWFALPAPASDQSRSRLLPACVFCRGPAACGEDNAPCPLESMRRKQAGGATAGRGTYIPCSCTSRGRRRASGPRGQPRGLRASSRAARTRCPDRSWG